MTVAEGSRAGPAAGFTSVDGTLLTVIGAFVFGGVVRGGVVRGAPVPGAFGRAAFESAPPTLSEAFVRMDVGKDLTSIMLEVLRSVP